MCRERLQTIVGERVKRKVVERVRDILFRGEKRPPFCYKVPRFLPLVLLLRAV
jgi:hypothetical protein